MLDDHDFLIPAWPEALQLVDVAKVRFVLNFKSACQVQPADFLELGRVLRSAGRQWLDAQDTAACEQWKALFQPALSEDPIALRKFQKPAPAFVVSMPIRRQESMEPGGHLSLEVLFVGTGIPLIHQFLRSLIDLGHLGLVAGAGHFEVSGVYRRESDGSESLIWQQHESRETLTCTILPLSWLLQDGRIKNTLALSFMTPTRLMVDGKPLRKPHFRQVFPFMLRRVTSMLYAHSGVELLDDASLLLEQVRQLNVVESNLGWHDWRSLSGRPGLVIGGFVGDMVLQGQALEEVYWVIAVASLLGIGKAATYGAGQFMLSY